VSVGVIEIEADAQTDSVVEPQMVGLADVVELAL